MAAASFETLLPEVLMYAAQCPEPVALNAIRNACIELCNESLCLQEEMDPIATSANESAYPVDAPTGYDIVQVLKPLYFEGKKLQDFATMMVTSYEDWRQQTGNRPLAWTCFQPDEITVWPIPLQNSTSGLTGRIAIAPTVSATGVESRILSEYRLVLRDGALAQILDYPDQPFTNPVKADAFAKAFRAGVTNARVRVSQAFMDAPLRIQYNRSF